MGIVKKQKKEIERLNGKIKTLKRMCERREQELKRLNASEAAAEVLIKVLIARNGGEVEITDSEWEKYKDMKVVGRYSHVNGCQEYRMPELTENNKRK